MELRDARLLPPDHVIFTDLDGRDGVLVDLNTKQYYQLNETASVIWRSLARGVPFDDVVQQIVDSYEVTVDHARTSVEKIVRNLVASRLLTLA